MATDQENPYLKYALFCRDSEEGPDGDLVLKGVIDLVDLPEPAEAPERVQTVLAELSLGLPCGSACENLIRTFESGDD